MNINQFIQEYRECKVIAPNVTSCHTPHVWCHDGFTMSVQAGPSLYSNPKDVADSYESVEVDFPSEYEPLLSSHGYEDQPNCGVFAFVPCSLVDEIIKKHGGIDESQINYWGEV